MYKHWGTIKHYNAIIITRCTAKCQDVVGFSEILDIFRAYFLLEKTGSMEKFFGIFLEERIRHFDKFEKSSVGNLESIIEASGYYYSTIDLSLAVLDEIRKGENGEFCGAQL